MTRMSYPFLITADEINCLIYSYFQDSGFQHSAFTLCAEANLKQSPHFQKHIPRGELAELLSKALLFLETETHWKGNFTCKSGFSLLEPHVCKVDLISSAKSIEPLKTNGSTEDTVVKRKASTPTNEGRSEKRARTEPQSMDQVAVASAPESSNAKPIEKKPRFDPRTIAGGSFLDKKAKKRPPGPADNETDPTAVRLLTEHTAEVFVCAWNPVRLDLLATGSKDAVVNIWTLPPRSDATKPPTNSEPVLSLKNHFGGPDQGDLTALDWNFDGSLLAIGSYDSILRVCTPSGGLYFSSPQHKGPLFTTRFSKSGRWLLTASLDATVCVWDVKGKKLHTQYRCHSDCCLDVDWLDESTFASCGADMMIHVMKLDIMKPIKSLVGHENEINQIKSNRTGTRLASCSDDQTARIWDITNITGRPGATPGLLNSDVIVLRGHKHSVSSIGWCPYSSSLNELVATSSFDGTARLWNATTGACTQIFSDHRRPVYALSFSPDGHWLATGSGDGWLHIYSVEKKEKKWSWYAGSEKPGVFEIDWQISGSINRIALALECRRVGVVDITRIPALQRRELSD